MGIMRSWFRKNTKAGILLVVLVAAALAIALLAVGCGSGLKGGTTTSATIQANTTVVTQGPGAQGPGIQGPSNAQRVVLKDGKATPNHLVINVGESVTFVNQDDDLPAAQQNHDIVSQAAGYDTGVLSAEEFYVATFQKAGTFPYEDKLHPEIKGDIVVE
jgi:plastocyanin